jgi:hypothetical protein
LIATTKTKYIVLNTAFVKLYLHRLNNHAFVNKLLSIIQSMLHD